MILWNLALARCYVFSNVLHCLLGVLFSFITIVYIYIQKQELFQTDSVTKRVCGTILLMDATSIASLIVV